MLEEGKYESLFVAIVLEEGKYESLFVAVTHDMCDQHTTYFQLDAFALV